MKLFRCEVNFVYYAVGEDADDARDESREALSDACQVDFTEVEPFRDMAQAKQDGWGPDALVYGTRQDLTLEAAVKQCAS